MIICLSLLLKKVCHVLIVCLVHKALSSALGLHSSRLEDCQNHLKDSTELLQVSNSHATQETKVERERIGIFTFLRPDSIFRYLKMFFLYYTTFTRIVSRDLSGKEK